MVHCFLPDPTCLPLLIFFCILTEPPAIARWHTRRVCLSLSDVGLLLISRTRKRLTVSASSLNGWRSFHCRRSLGLIRQQVRLYSSICVVVERTGSKASKVLADELQVQYIQYYNYIYILVTKYSTYSIYMCHFAWRTGNYRGYKILKYKFFPSLRTISSDAIRFSSAEFRVP